MIRFTAPGLRLTAALLAFFAWIGYLLFLTITTRTSVVLSRPQFLVSTLDVVAQIDSPEGGKVKVEEVSWPKGDPDHLKGKEINVSTNFADCDGWTGPGKYILALAPRGPDTYQVVPIPRTPGFPRRPWETPRPRIYPATPETIRQLEDIPKAAN
jgi:hypothetical protein